jgi:hypothetical protein
MNKTHSPIRSRGAALIAAAVLAAAAGSARADNEATQDISISVSAVNEIEVTAGTVTITVNSATAGTLPSGTGSSSYALTTNSVTSKKITAHLVSGLASGLTLTAQLAAPSTGSSSGVVTLGTSDSDVVTSIEAVNQTGLSIGYVATATIAVASGSYDADVIYTLVNDS